MTTTGPHPPAFAVPPHLAHPSEPLSIWFTQPLGLLTQITRPSTGSVEMVRFITELAWPALLELRGAGSQPLYIVHDLSLLEDVEPEAGRLMSLFGLSIRKHIERVVVVEPPALHRLVHLAISAVGSALGLIGIPMELAPSLHTVLDQYGLRVLDTRQEA
jgi:hypothetical protein